MKLQKLSRVGKFMKQKKANWEGGGWRERENIGKLYIKNKDKLESITQNDKMETL